MYKMDLPISMKRRSTLFLMLLGITVIVGIYLYIPKYLSNLWQIQVVRVNGEFNKTGQDKIRLVTEAYVDCGFFKLDLKGLQNALLQLPWISQVNISRLWPHTLEISIAEKKAVALWNNTSLLNTDGKVFTPESTSLLKNLPKIYGPEGMGAKVYEQYKKLAVLVKDIGVKIDQMHMDERHAIDVVLDNNLKIELGRNEPISRLKRFVALYDIILGTKVVNAEMVDLRYPNGLAVTWKA